MADNGLQGTPDIKRSQISVAHAYALLAATVLTWSIGIVIARAVHQEIPPVGLSFWRWVIATIMLFPFVWGAVRNNFRLVLRNLGYFWVQGIFMTGGGLLLFLGVNYTTAINASLVNATQPVFTVLIAWILIRDEIKSIQLIGIVSAFIGVVIMVTRADLEVVTDIDFNTGDWIVILATIFYSLYAVNLRKMPPDIGVFPALFVILLLGSLTLFPFYIVETIFIRPTIISVKLVIVVPVLALIVSILSLAMWNTGNARVGHNRAAIFVNLFPFYSGALAMIFLGEQLYFFHVIGVLFVCAGIFLVVRTD